MYNARVVYETFVSLKKRTRKHSFNCDCNECALKRRYGGMFENMPFAGPVNISQLRLKQEYRGDVSVAVAQ